MLRGIDADMSAAGSSVAERNAAYRNRLAEPAHAGNPVLIVADNAADAAAVRPLLPPRGPHRLLVTSRHTLHTLDARLIDLPILPDDASAELLATALRCASPADQRASTSPDALTALVRLCGGLPLALRITAALLIRDPHLTAAELAEELVEAGPMESLDDGEYAVRAALELSYQRLPPKLAELCCLLVLNPGPDLSTEAAGMLSGLRRPVLRRGLTTGHGWRLPMCGCADSPSRRKRRTTFPGYARRSSGSSTPAGGSGCWARFLIRDRDGRFGILREYHHAA